MQGYNLIVVYNREADKILMCVRRKDPYKGLSNFVGGKIEPGEDGYSAAYRELFEETSITKDVIALKHFADFTYYYGDCVVEVYVGRLKTDFDVKGTENELYWSDLNHNFFDSHSYAGEGNIGHILEEIDLLKDILLD